MNVSQAISELKSTLSVFTEESIKKKSALLKRIAKSKILLKTDAKLYYETLIFMAAHANNDKAHKEAVAEINRIEIAIAEKEGFLEKVSGSGILNSPVRGAFSYTLVCWLLNNFPDDIYLYSFGNGVHPREIIKNNLFPTEFELSLNEKLTAEKWIEVASGKKNKSEQIQWLISNFNALKCTSLIRDNLFESMQLFIEVKSSNPLFSLAGCKLNKKKFFYHKEELLKKIDFNKIIKEKIKHSKTLNDKEKWHVVNVSRAILLLLNRETDPITYCDTNEKHQLQLVELNRGLSIAFFSAEPSRRLPYESYIGFMMYKNGYPISYGGAWLFGKRALIGINIFEWFRGGESAFLFAQLIRSYHQVFGASYFEVEPYQFGKGNPEGINSGAFWFYYKFGFKPVNLQLKKLAEEEANKIFTVKGYRSSKSTLKAFTKSNIYVQLKNDQITLNPIVFSNYITMQITSQFKGDRQNASAEINTKLNQAGINQRGNKNAYAQWSSLIYFCINLNKLSKKNIRDINQLIVLKEENEFEYVKALVNFNIEPLLKPEFINYYKKKYPNLR
ncbi:MAG: hypothetical protein IPM51_14195 [Sphingobacteriaceae bacterium]|nr:hypothetical protein [Sphingobacteriaceae bacterium]